MKSSLASATSVIALLALESAQMAVPVVTIATSALGVLALDSEPASAGSISFSPASPLTIYDLVGDGNDTSVTETISGYNSNQASTRTLTGGTLSAAAISAGFGGGTNLSTKISKSSTKTANETYSYEASTTGSSSATVVFKISGTGGATSTLTLIGTGVAPVAGMTGGSAGNILVGQTAAVAVTVTNSGNGNKSGLGAASNLNGTIGSASGGLFSGAGAGISIGDTASQTINYVFAPTQTGTATTTIIGTFSNGAASTNAAVNKTVTLSGTGVAPVGNLAVSNNGSTGAGAVAGTGTVGNVLVGNTVTTTLTISNSGNGNLSGLGTISDLNGTAGKAGSSAFVGSGGTFGLHDAGSATATYAFTPTGRGAVNTTVVTSFTNGMGAGGANQSGAVTTTLSGTGVAPVLNLTGSAAAGYVLVGQTATLAVTVNNTGDGNKSGLGAVSNLNGTMGTAGTGGFSGGGAAVSLKDTTSTTYTYVYTPTTRGASSTTFTSSFTNGSATNGSAAPTTTLSGTGVAPVNNVSTTNAGLVRIGTSGTAAVSISNTGDGNKSGLGAISNLNGTIATALGAGFTAKGGNPGSVSLADAASSTLGYTFTPISHAASTTTATISFSNGNTSGANTAQTVTATVSAQGVGPTYQSSYKSAVNTPTAATGGATASTGPTISFGSLGLGLSQTVYLNLANITGDANGGNDALTDLTIESFTIADGTHFSTSFTPGTVIHKGGSVLVPITVFNTSALGLLTSTLTFITDEGVALGGALGNTYTYQLSALVVPEPTSLAILGAGLAGLAGLRRRRAAQ